MSDQTATTPLRSRLPNPPPIFKGRLEEMAHLARAVSRGPVTVVCGLGGIGKTALVRQTLHHSFPDQIPRVLQLRPQGEDLVVEVVRALARAKGVSLDWSVVLGDPEYSLVTAIDLADEGPWWVVIEDLHRTDWASAEETLEMLARYARQSRWIVTSRLRPTRHFEGQVLSLGTLSDAALGDIARDWAPGLTDAEVQTRVRSASGSPWRLYQTLSGETEADPNSLEALSPEARGFLERLAVLERPVPLSALGPGGIGEGVLEGLQRRGLVVEEQAAYRIHDVARAPVLGACADLDETRAALIAALEADRSASEALLEGLRLRIELGAEILPQLDANAEALVEAGYGPDLTLLLARAPGPEVQLWRLRVAVETGDLERLARFEPPPSPNPQMQLQWCRALYEMSRFQEVVEGLSGLDADLSLSISLRTKAQILRANATMACGRLEDAEAALKAIEPPDEAARRHIEELSAALLAMLGRVEEALALVRRLRRGLADLDDAARPRSALRLVRSLYLLGHIAEASEILEETLEEVGPRAFGLTLGRKAVQIQLAIAISLGRLGQADRLLERLQPFMTSGYAACRVDLQRLLCRLFRGDLSGFSISLDAAVEQAREIGYGDALFACLDIGRRFAILQAAPLGPPHSEALAPETRFFDHQLNLRQHLHALLSGHNPPPLAVPGPEPLVQLSAMQTVVEATASLLSDDLKAAREGIEESVAASEAADQHLELTGALEICCDIHLCGQDELELLRHRAGQLLALAETMDSERFRTATALISALSDLQTLDPAHLEAIAQCDATSPRAARRARALLGEPVALDRLDAKVVDAIRCDALWVPIQTRRGAGSESATLRWGLDKTARRVWRSDGHTAELARRGRLWALLDGLVQRGAADKETLVQAVWGERVYHPLKHDNRLRLAVRRLRDLCRDDGDMILTTEAGYALGGVYRVRSRP